jgi:hypothetical protein
VAVAAILILKLDFRFCNISARHVVLNLYITVHENRSIYTRVIVICLRSKMAAFAILILIFYFRFYNTPTRHVVLNLCIKFHEVDRSTFARDK